MGEKKFGDEPTSSTRLQEQRYEQDRAVTEYYRNRRMLVDRGQFPLDDGSTNAEG